jgi:flavin-binding protein dodecin
MSIAKVIEILAEGETIEEAFENAVEEASQTVDSIQSVWTSDIEAKVENEEIQFYRITAKVTFAVNKS